ncbi:MAG: hypothetical protein ACRD5B_03165 [Nitrososphaeraceae archaeon]
MSEENIDDNNDKRLLPVTVIVKRIAKKNKIKEFEEWLSGISKEVSRQAGSMGIDIIKPTDKESKPEYVIIFRFNNYDKNGRTHQQEMNGYKEGGNWYKLILMYKN